MYIIIKKNKNNPPSPPACIIMSPPLLWYRLLLSPAASPGPLARLRPIVDQHLPCAHPDTLAAWLHLAACSGPHGEAMARLGCRALGLDDQGGVGPALAAALAALGTASCDLAENEDVEGLVCNLERMAFADVSNAGTRDTCPPSGGAKDRAEAKKWPKKSRRSRYVLVRAHAHMCC